LSLPYFTTFFAQSLLWTTTDRLPFETCYQLTQAVERGQSLLDGDATMHRFAILFPLLSALTRAQDRVVPLFLLEIDDSNGLAASVISANPSTTEYLIGCAGVRNPNACGPYLPETVRHAGSVFAGSITAAAYTKSWECTVTPAPGTQAICTSSIQRGGGGGGAPAVGTNPIGGAQILIKSVTVTAGAEQLAAETATILPSNALEPSSSAATNAGANGAPTAGVGLGMAGLAAIALAI
jgi:hypothetical protein